MDVMNRVNPAKREAVAKVTPEVKAYHDRMARFIPADFEPTQTMRDSMDLEVAGVKLSLRHFGPGHTDNDVVVHVPALNLVHTGDLLFNKRHPYVDRDGGANTASWQASLTKVIELCDDKTVVVPGHGELANVAALREQIEYFDKARDLVARAIKAGKSRADVQHLEPTMFPGYQGTAWQLTLRAIFEELQEQSGAAPANKPAGAPAAAPPQVYTPQPVPTPTHPK
jgi:glyoxylase-like metal-dependent hydrolase (beta-lactamase superfamily II)